MRIAVLMGGSSPEREVSLRSGKAITNALRRLGHTVYELDWDETLVIRRYKELQEFELVFIGYHGGFGEDGHVQAVLEMLGIPFTGSSSVASMLGMNKIYSKRIFRQAGIPTPPGFEIEKPDGNELEEIDKMIREDFGYPVIVKPSTSGSTIGLSLIYSSDELPLGIAEARKYSRSYIVEKYIKGRELTVSILADRVLPIVEIVPSKGLYDYTCKYTKGMSQYICPAVLGDHIREKLERYGMLAFNLLGCSGYGRVDFRFDGENVYCLEVNTLPGMTELSLVPMAAKAAEISFDELINKILKEALKRKV